MDTQCEVKPNSKPNQGTGSNLLDYISSAEKGREFLFLPSLYVYIAVADGNTHSLLMIEKDL